MDAQEFREFGRAAIDFVADYLENIRDRWEAFYLLFLNQGTSNRGLYLNNMGFK